MGVTTFLLLLELKKGALNEVDENYPLFRGIYREKRMVDRSIVPAVGSQQSTIVVLILHSTFFVSIDP